MNTIFALCSGYGRAGVAVFRISGKYSKLLIEELTDLDSGKLEARKMYYTKIHDPETKKLIDHGMIVFFAGKSSFTGEDSLEIHVHGSIAVINLLSSVLTKQDKLRLAEPGEFARRAFINGKFDLTSAEGLADLIDAETELQHSQAIKQLGGGLEQIYEGWRTKLLKIISLLEAFIDFPDEEIPAKVLKDTNELVSTLVISIKNHLNDNRRGERLRNGLKLAIIGRPNVGKSSMLNFLLQREVAIVSDIAGTTRDMIEGHLDIGGYPIILQDTAGIRDKTKDVIEEKGIEIAHKAKDEADICLFMLDASNLQEDYEYFEQFFTSNTILVINKCDLSLADDLKINYQKSLKISLKDNLNLELVHEEIKKLAQKLAGPSSTPQITRARHRASLEKALSSLEQFNLDGDLVLATEDLRMTIRYISNITGKITVDEILGEIFSNFCIGK